MEKHRDERKVICILIVALIAISIMSACKMNTGDEATIKWISEHRKPIAVIGGDTTIAGQRRWTLIDADANVWQTLETYMVFPDTLKTSIRLIEK